MIETVYTQNSCQTEYLTQHDMIEQQEHYRIDYDQLYQLADYLDQTPIEQQIYMNSEQAWQTYLAQNEDVLTLRNMTQFYKTRLNIIEWSLFTLLVCLFPEILLQKYLKFLKQKVKRKESQVKGKETPDKGIQFQQKQGNLKYKRLIIEICVSLVIMGLNFVARTIVLSLLVLAYILVQGYSEFMGFQEVMRELYQKRNKNEEKQSQGMIEDIQKTKQTLCRIKRLIIYYQCTYQNVDSIAHNHSKSNNPNQGKMAKVRQIVRQLLFVLQKYQKQLHFGSDFSYQEIIKKLDQKAETIKILSTLNKLQTFIFILFIKRKIQLRQLFGGKIKQNEQNLQSSLFKRLFLQIREIVQLKQKYKLFEQLKESIKAFQGQLQVLVNHFQRLKLIDQQLQMQFSKIGSKARQFDRDLYRSFLVKLYNQNVKICIERQQLQKLTAQQLDFRQCLIDLLIKEHQLEKCTSKKQQKELQRQNQISQQADQFPEQQEANIVRHKYTNKENFQTQKKSVIFTTQGNISQIQSQQRKIVVQRLNKALENMLKKPNKNKVMENSKNASEEVHLLNNQVQKEEESSERNDPLSFKRVNIFQMQGLVLPKPKLDFYQ